MKRDSITSINFFTRLQTRVARCLITSNSRRNSRVLDIISILFCSENDDAVSETNDSLCDPSVGTLTEVENEGGRCASGRTLENNQSMKDHTSISTYSAE